jgi:hypothetical protein
VLRSQGCHQRRSYQKAWSMLRAGQEALAAVWRPRPGYPSHITPPPLALSTLLSSEPKDRAATVKGSENAGIVAHDTRRALCLVLIHRPGCHHHIIPHPPKVSALLCSSWCRQTEEFLVRRSTSAVPTVGSAVPKPCLTVFAPPRPPSDATLSNHSKHALQRLFVSATGRI